MAGRAQEGISLSPTGIQRTGRLADRLLLRDFQNGGRDWTCDAEFVERPRFESILTLAHIPDERVALHPPPSNRISKCLKFGVSVFNATLIFPSSAKRVSAAWPIGK